MMDFEKVIGELYDRARVAPLSATALRDALHEAYNAGVEDAAIKVGLPGNGAEPFLSASIRKLKVAP